jgi:hypothetical protein
MSIIQEALRKAELEKKVSQAGPSTPPGAGAPAAQEHHHAHADTPQRKQQSLMLPALVSVLFVLIIIYGLKSSIQYSAAHANRIAARNAASQAVPLNVPKINPITFGAMRAVGLTLSGIMYVGGRPQAIINGNILEEGDKINGATILAIERDCVLLQMNEESVKLEINK